jgi:hypothetical protein
MFFCVEAPVCTPVVPPSDSVIDPLLSALERNSTRPKHAQPPHNSDADDPSASDSESNADASENEAFSSENDQGLVPA